MKKVPYNNKSKLSFLEPRVPSHSSMRWVSVTATYHFYRSIQYSSTYLPVTSSSCRKKVKESLEPKT